MATACCFQIRLFGSPTHGGEEFELTRPFVPGGRRPWKRRHLVVTASSGSDSISPGKGSPPRKQIVVLKAAAVEFSEPYVAKFREIVSSAPSFVLAIKRQPGIDFLLGFCVATACLIIVARVYVARRLSSNQSGTVADLVRRGQLRSDTRGISKPLKYEDPFNNPLVKVGKGNSSVEMCGKVYKLAPVTLTEELRAVHQKRRSRAYQWKRPKVFLKEGDAIPPDVDPETVRWIPANHPFATTASDIDEDLAHDNVYQKHGVPFRIQAEHEALQRKLESLQGEQKLDKLYIDPRHAKDFERALKAQERSREQSPGLQNGQTGDARPAKSDVSPASHNRTSAPLPDEENVD